MDGKDILVSTAILEHGGVRLIHSSVLIIRLCADMSIIIGAMMMTTLKTMTHSVLKEQ